MRLTGHEPHHERTSLPRPRPRSRGAHVAAAAAPPIRDADRSLADQLQRAATSVALNIAEGSHRRGRDRAHVYRIAAGSAAESRSCLEAATALGHVDAAAATVAWHRLDQVIAILWRVTH